MLIISLVARNSGRFLRAGFTLACFDYKRISKKISELIFTELLEIQQAFKRLENLWYNSRYHRCELIHACGIHKTNPTTRQPTNATSRRFAPHDSAVENSKRLGKAQYFFTTVNISFISAEHCPSHHHYRKAAFATSCQQQ
jgi:hypothetical protein